MVQAFALKETRLGIPLLLAEECPHGMMSIGSTTFPCGLAVAAAMDADLAHRIAAAVASELAESGAHIGFGPVADLSLDPRWGRSEENFGEDPWLSGHLASAFVQGFQASGRVGCTLKHFAGYGASEGGRNAGPAPIGEREMRNSHLPPFEQAVRAGAASVMSSYNAVDGVPVSGDRRYLTGILREEWGFDGLVISDSGAVPELQERHRVASDPETAAALALRAGIDLDLCPVHRPGFHEALERAVERGLIDISLIDAAVGRVLDYKERIGLFREPFGPAPTVELSTQCAEHRRLAAEAAVRSVVLLKNEKNLLPLGDEKRRIALIGPNADDVFNMLGDYTAPQPAGKVTTIRTALAARPQWELRYAQGCRIKTGEASEFQEALECAEWADVIIAVMGGSSKREAGIQFAHAGQAVVDATTDTRDMDCGESSDRASLDLLGRQNELLWALQTTGKPLITVLIHGRAMSVARAAELSDALLTAFYPGEEGGEGIAAILEGSEAPSGRLPVTFPRSAGQLPVHYRSRNSLLGDYVDGPLSPLFPFGFGLSTSTFEWEPPTLSRHAISAKELLGGSKLQMQITLRNTGRLRATEVVQLYVHDEFASIARPDRELKRVSKITLNPGDTGSVIFELDAACFAFWNGSLQLEPGRFQLIAAKHAEDAGLTHPFNINS